MKDHPEQSMATTVYDACESGNLEFVSKYDFEKNPTDAFVLAQRAGMSGDQKLCLFLMNKDTIDVWPHIDQMLATAMNRGHTALATFIQKSKAQYDSSLASSTLEATQPSLPASLPASLPELPPLDSLPALPSSVPEPVKLEVKQVEVLPMKLEVKPVVKPLKPSITIVDPAKDPAVLAPLEATLPSNLIVAPTVQRTTTAKKTAVAKPEVTADSGSDTEEPTAVELPPNKVDATKPVQVVKAENEAVFPKGMITYLGISQRRGISDEEYRQLFEAALLENHEDVFCVMLNEAAMYAKSKKKPHPITEAYADKFFYLAAERGMKQALDLLYLYKPNINYGLEGASVSGHMELLIEFLGRGANSFNSAFGLACKNDHKEIAKVLAAKGVTVCPTCSKPAMAH